MSCSKSGNLSRPKFPLVRMTDESYQVMNKGTNDITMKRELKANCEFVRGQVAV